MKFDMPIFCVDCETGGDVNGRPQMIEIAGLRVEPDLKMSFYETLVRNEFPVDPQSSAIHQLRDEDLADGVSAMDAVSEILKLGEDAVWVLFNSPYDLGVIGGQINEELKELASGVIALDAYRLSVHCWPNSPSHKLHSIYHQLGLPREKNIHRAGPDVRITCQILRQISKQMNCWETARLLDIANCPLPITQMKFGKHIGQPLSEIPVDYFDWWLNKRAPGPDENYDLNYAMAAELRSRGVDINVEQYRNVAIASASKWSTPFVNLSSTAQLG